MAQREPSARTPAGDRPSLQWLPMPEDACAARIAATLAQEHISVSTTEPFASTTPTPQALQPDRTGLPVRVADVHASRPAAPGG
jgi:hypothetical protein